MKKSYISNNVIRRLPRYLRKLDELSKEGIERISSGELGNQMGLTPSQIRQDFSCFGEFGQQGYGYNVRALHREIATILGLRKSFSVILIGVGNLGHALLQNFHFAQAGFTVDAAFDVSPSVTGTRVNGVPIYSMEKLDDYIRAHRVDVVVLTLPQSIAQEIADRLIDLGVRGFWNFTNVEITCGQPDVKIENIHFADSLLTLSYRIANR